MEGYYGIMIVILLAAILEVVFKIVLIAVTIITVIKINNKVKSLKGKNIWELIKGQWQDH